MQQEIALLLVVLGFAPPVQRARCHRPPVRVDSWATAQSPRLPGLTLRLPPQFTGDSGESAYDAAHPGAANGSRWAHPDGSHISVVRVSERDPAITLPAASDTLAEYSRCVERRDGGRLIVVSYNRLTEVGDLAFLGPFMIFADLQGADGIRIQAFGSATTRQSFEQLLGTVRTVAQAR